VALITLTVRLQEFTLKQQKHSSSNGVAAMGTVWSDPKRVDKKETAKTSKFKHNNNVSYINLAGDRQVFFEDVRSHNSSVISMTS
jgi:hypothetical protein